MFEDDETPTHTYRVIHGRIIGYTDDSEAMQQAIDKILSTPRFQFEIYSESYGHDLEDIVGAEMSLAKAEIERLVIEALEVDDRVLSVSDFNFQQPNRSSLFVGFKVNTIFGSLNEEMEVAI